MRDHRPPAPGRDRYLPHTLTLIGAAGLSRDEILAALHALQDYAPELITRKEAEDGEEDHIRMLLAESRRPGAELTRDDVASFVVAMLIAGYKTNMQHTGNALLTLLTHPDQLHRLRERPAGIPTAVDELLRHVPLMNATNILVAEEDFTLHGQRIRAGDAVVPVPASANRDPKAFTDLARTPNPHLAFGHGPHACTGAHLTRMQLAVVIQVLLEELPGIELAEPAESLPWDETTPLRAPARLPVRW
ncbi:cytochrome P450 [Kitasatospora sp. NPDC059648]|uniref:cytochrome P450 n=1 Tax=Kitasatospora sp. NPDC059648 TaxID=3346894 RepID=UPI003685AFB6